MIRRTDEPPRRWGWMGSWMALCLMTSMAGAQSAAGRDREISGTIVDLDMAPVADATVTGAAGEATAVTAVTAADGSFTLTGLPSQDAVIEVMAEGFVPTRIPVIDTETEPRLQVVLPRSPEVHAVPMRGRAIGGLVRDASGAPTAGVLVRIRGTERIAVTAIDGSFTLHDAGLDDVVLDIEPTDRPATSTTVARDRVAIVITVGAPVPKQTHPAEQGPDSPTGASAAILARLPLRVTAPFDDLPGPLYVLDGVVLSELADLSGAFGLFYAGPVHRIAGFADVEIERVEVLEGASAVALYGAKAVHGVVAITTKRGRNGVNHANVTQRFGLAEPSKKLGARTFTLDDVRAAFCGHEDPMRCDRSTEVMIFRAANRASFDNEAEILRTTLPVETVGTISGRTDAAMYHGALLYRDEPGVVIGTGSQKQSARLGLAYQPGTRARMGLAVNLLHSVLDRGSIYNELTSTSLYDTLSHTPSFFDLRAKNGIYSANRANRYSSPNPVQTANLLQNREDTWRSVIDARLTIDAAASADGTSALTLLGNFGHDRSDQNHTVVSPAELVDEPLDGLPGTVIHGSTMNLQWNTGTGALWTLSPQGSGFRSALSVGLTYEGTHLHVVDVQGRNLSAGQPNTGYATNVRTHDDEQRTTAFGFYAQEEIAMFDDRLTFVTGALGERSNLNTRTDQYFLYPKLAAVFRMIGAGSAWGRPALLDSLRVRAAYGEAGKPPPFGVRSSPPPTVEIIDGHLVSRPVVLLPDDLEPERQRELEIDLAVAAKDQRVVAELTGYQRSVSNAFSQRVVRGDDGRISFKAMNAGGMRRRGVRAAMQVRPIVTGWIEWTSRGTLTLDRSMITEVLDGQLYNAYTAASSLSSHLGAYRIEPGKSATQIVMMGDGKIVAVGDSEPDFRVSWANGLSLGNLTLTAHIDWRHGSDIVNVTRRSYDLNQNSPDTEAAARRLAAYDQGDLRPYVEDASFVKLREVSVSYAVPARIAAHLGSLKRLELTVSGRNLLTFTGYSGLDPELSDLGLASLGRFHDVAPVPPTRSYWISVTAGI